MIKSRGSRPIGRTSFHGFGPGACCINGAGALATLGRAALNLLCGGLDFSRSSPALQAQSHAIHWLVVMARRCPGMPLRWRPPWIMLPRPDSSRPWEAGCSARPLQLVHWHTPPHTHTALAHCSEDFFEITFMTRFHGLGATYLAAVIVGSALVLGIALAAEAAITAYSDRAAFEAALAPGAYTEAQIYSAYPDYAGGSGSCNMVGASGGPYQIQTNDQMPSNTDPIINGIQFWLRNQGFRRFFL